jgi:metal-responsive CopG/Arc/MetJ family transcriptional regulator
MTSGITFAMNVAKITISIDQNLLNSVDQLIMSKVFASRSQALQVAVQEKIARINKIRLIQESAKLDPVVEQALADEGLASELDTWPEY